MVLLGSSIRLGQISNGLGDEPRRVRLFCKFGESYVVAADWASKLEFEWLEARLPLPDGAAGRAIPMR